GVNYLQTSGTLNFKRGKTQATFYVQILQSAMTTPKTFNLVLSQPSAGATIGAPGSAVMTLTAAPPSGGAGPVAAYSFSEGGGTTTADSSGNNNTGNLVGAPTWTTGKYGGGLLFDGIGDYVDLGNGTTLQATGSMTVSAWINAAAFPVD